MTRLESAKAFPKVQALIGMQRGNFTYFAVSDANQNVVQVLNVSTGEISASYDYDPFGNLLQATGDYGRRNPFKFAGKYFDV